MIVKNIKDVESVEINMEGAKDVIKKVPVGIKDGTPTMSFRVFQIKPGGCTPFHSHPQEHVNIILEGEGILVNEKGEGRTLKVGDFALVLPNEKHQYKNNSGETFTMVCAVRKEYE